MCHILDMIYKVWFGLEQFYKEPIYSKYAPNIYIMAILLINGPRNTHLLIFTKQCCGFYSNYSDFRVFFFGYLDSNFWYIRKKHLQKYFWLLPKF